MSTELGSLRSNLPCRTTKAIVFALALGAAALGSTNPAFAQSGDPETVYGRKGITLTVGYAPGGSYDLYARFTARFLGRHLPGKPSVVVQNMPGAGSLQAANYLYSVAPKDGTAIGVVVETLPMEQALQNPGVKYDAARFTFIGRIATSNNIQLVWHTAKAKSIEDVMTIETSVAGTGPANLAETVPRVLNALVGTRFKIVSGYPSSGPGMLAMERGEVDGAATSWAIVKSQRMDWINSGKARIILQFVPTRAKDLPHVPALGELGKTDEARQILDLYASGGALGRYVIAPPDLPPEMTRALRDGFDAMVRDPEFLAEARKVNLDVDPAPGPEIEAVARRTLQVSDAVRQKVREIFK
jgi:tripartite-type tricarboxylate transporter receptor subunit TctC